MLSTEINITESHRINNKNRSCTSLECYSHGLLTAYAYENWNAIRSYETDKEISGTDKELTDSESEAEVAKLSKWLTEVDSCEADKATFQEWLCNVILELILLKFLHFGEFFRTTGLCSFRYSLRTNSETK